MPERVIVFTHSKNVDGSFSSFGLVYSMGSLNCTFFCFCVSFWWWYWKCLLLNWEVVSLFSPYCSSSSSLLPEWLFISRPAWSL